VQPVYYGYLLSVHGKINFKTFKELVIGFAFCLSVHFNLDFLCASKSLRLCYQFPFIFIIFQKLSDTQELSGQFVPVPQKERLFPP